MEWNYLSGEDWRIINVAKGVEIIEGAVWYCEWRVYNWYGCCSGPSDADGRLIAYKPHVNDETRIKVDR